VPFYTELKCAVCCVCHYGRKLGSEAAFRADREGLLSTDELRCRPRPIYSRFLFVQFQRSQLFVENVGIDAVRLEVAQEVGVPEPVTMTFILAQSTMSVTRRSMNNSRDDQRQLLKNKSDLILFDNPHENAVYDVQYDISSIPPPF